MAIARLLSATCTLLVLVTSQALLADGSGISKFSVDIEDKLTNYNLPKDAAIQFSFAKHFQSHMVLQQAPQRANIYGFSPHIGAAVVVELTVAGNVYNYNTVVTPTATQGLGVWSVKLDPFKTNNSVSVQAKSNGTSLRIEDVLFGDVWVCSGQSNMQFMVEQIFGADEVIANSLKYPKVRFMNVYREGSSTPLDDLIAVAQNWTPPTKATVAAFSSVCWLYGTAIYDALGYPIGLVGTDYGGTPVEAWSSPVALSKCGVNKTGIRSSSSSSGHQPLSYLETLLPPGPNNNSVLWNAMVHPLLEMTIYGAIWYQGEQDATTPDMMNRYNCTFPAMIDDWRLNFNKESFGETSEMFPFGFVQLATSMPPDLPGFTDIRWHQTADIGYVPNKRLPQVFMAVALDLPDFDSPSGPVHTRYKQEVGFRLSLSGLAVAYNKAEVFQGPFPLSAEILSNTTLIVDYGEDWLLNVRNTEGFELLCSSGNRSTITWWLPTSIISFTTRQITILASICGEGQRILGLRYAWQTTPCALKTCAIYSAVNELPAPPFVVLSENVNGNPVFRFRK